MKNLFPGTENESFDLLSVKRMHDVLKKLNPEQDYQMDPIPGYGHVDHFIGKNACYDVWPKILRFLDKYAENNVMKNNKLIKSMKKAVNKIQLVTTKKPGEYLTNYNRTKH